MIEMVGTEATWANFAFKEEDRDFQRWARSETEGPLPPLTPDTKINCWEMILYAALTTEPPVLTHAKVHNMYNYDREPNDEWWGPKITNSLTPNGRQEYTVEPPGPLLPNPGDLVLWNRAGGHVALATGRVHEDNSPEVISFWPPPGEHRKGDIYAEYEGGERTQTWARRDRVKISSIKELYDYMVDPPGGVEENYKIGGRVIVEFGPGPW